MNVRDVVSPTLLLQAGAALCYATGGAFMKASDGLSQLKPTIAVFALFAIGACFQTLSMKLTTMGTAYILVLGLEGIVALALGLAYFHESFSVRDVIGVLLILAGTIVLRAGMAVR